MLLVDACITVGILTGMKACAKPRKKRNASWLSHVTSLEESQAVARSSLWQAMVQKFTTQPILLPLTDRRRQQLREVAAAEPEPAISEAEHRTQHYLIMSLTTMDLSMAGALVYAPLSFAGVAGLIYVSLPFYQQAYRSLVHERRVDASVIDAIIATVSIATGNYVAWAWVCSFLYFAQIVLRQTEDHSRNRLINVSRLQSRSVWVLVDGMEVETPRETLRIGDIVVVNAGETIPIDGTITEGIASVDQHMLTGESKPAEKVVGDIVFASTVVLMGRLCIEVEKAQAETTIAKLENTLNRTAGFELSIQSRGEAIADSTALPVLMLGGITLFALGPAATLAVLNADFAYYMRVLAPIGMLNFLNVTSHHGILIKDGRVLDLLAKVDTVVFDKTGTLTHEQPRIRHIYTCDSYDENEVLTYAAAAEHRQTHPIALAIRHESQTRHLHVPDIESAAYIVGYGLTVKLDNRHVHVGSTRFMEMEKFSIPPTLREVQEDCRIQGHSLVLVAIDRQVVGAIELDPAIRPEAQAVVRGLRQRNITAMYIISGDHERPTKKLAETLGIDHYFAEIAPEQKAALIKQLQADGKCVCYIGDGINDAIALKTAQVSISLRGASTVATDAAQIVLMDQSLNQLVSLFDLTQRFDTTMKQTFTAALLPGILTVGGVFFLQFGLIQSIILSEIGFAIGLGNVLYHSR